MPPQGEKAIYPLPGVISKPGPLDPVFYLVPYVKEKGTRFLKTIIPSRKATREYLA